VLVLLVSSICTAEEEIEPADLIGYWKVKTTSCDGNMWWRPTAFSMRSHGDDVYVYYERYDKKGESEEWTVVINPRPDEPVARVYTVKNEFYYFEIELVQSYGIANKVRFYLNMDKRARRKSGTLLRTVSFPVDQIDKAEEVLGSTRILEGSGKWATDSYGNRRQLVDVIVGSCEIGFTRARSK
jgi:hypothetical protein